MELGKKYWEETGILFVEQFAKFVSYFSHCYFFSFIFTGKSTGSIVIGTVASVALPYLCLIL